MKKKINFQGFTLIEIMIGILITSIVLIGGFTALSAVTIGKVKLVQQTDIQKESFYFTQKLFEMIKKGGVVDYEEYFNRKVIGNNNYSSGHFDTTSGFGNFGNNGAVGTTTTTYGDGFYYCISKDGTKMTSGSGCVTDFNYNQNSNIDININYSLEQQRYGQYSFQFIDYNGNYDDDGTLLGDEDGDGNIIGDDDDEYLGDGPEAFSEGVGYPELYLISGNKKERTYFRWKVIPDPALGITANCSLDSTTNIITGTGCLGTIEYLKLEGKDWGMDHNNATLDNTENDGIIDTWIINTEFSGGVEVVAGSDTENYWIPLFPETINVSEFKVYAYPNKDITYAWKSEEDKINIAPYVIIKLKIKPSWISRKKIGGAGKEIDFSMTINLTDIYSK